MRNEVTVTLSSSALTRWAWLLDYFSALVLQVQQYCSKMQEEASHEQAVTEHKSFVFTGSLEPVYPFRFRPTLAKSPSYRPTQPNKHSVAFLSSTVSPCRRRRRKAALNARYGRRRHPGGEGTRPCESPGLPWHRATSAVRNGPDWRSFNGNLAIRFLTTTDRYEMEESIALFDSLVVQISQ